MLLPGEVDATDNQAVHNDIAARWRGLVDAAVGAVGTPCYVTDWQPVRTAAERLERIGNGTPAVRCWLSYKTHPLPHLASEWTMGGRGVEVVSACELSTLLERGCPVDRLLVNGVAKHRWLPDHPVRRLRVHFDSLLELDELLPLAVACDWRVGIRCHVPDEADARDPRFGGQFGMSKDEAIAGLQRLRRAGLEVESMHFHLGQIEQSVGPYVRAVDHLKSICLAANATPTFIDCGGGLPTADDRRWPDAFAGVQAAVGRIAELFPEVTAVWLEHGRYMTTSSTVLAVRVLDIKERPECRYLVCDGGRTNHALAADIRPHPLVPLTDRSGSPRLTTVCGPTCMTDDRLARVELPGDVAVGDVLIWMEAGAYHLPWETRFSHGLCAVVWFGADGQPTIARERERARSATDLWAPAAHHVHG